MEKKLYKSNQNKMLDGVCGGIAEYFGIDPTVVRLIWALFSLMGGCGILGVHHRRHHHSPQSGLLTGQDTSNPRCSAVRRRPSLQMPTDSGISGHCRGRSRIFRTFGGRAASASGCFRSLSYIGRRRCGCTVLSAPETARSNCS